MCTFTEKKAKMGNDMFKIIEKFADSQYFRASRSDPKAYYLNKYTKLSPSHRYKVQDSEADCPLLGKLYCNDLIV